MLNEFTSAYTPTYIDGIWVWQCNVPTCRYTTSEVHRDVAERRIARHITSKRHRRNDERHRAKGVVE